jgi:hypothetical protein
VYAYFWVCRSYREELQPLEDPLIKRCLHVISQNPHTRSNSSIISAAKSTLSQFVSLSELAWIPTGCLVRITVNFAQIFFSMWLTVNSKYAEDVSADFLVALHIKRSFLPIE